MEEATEKELQVSEIIQTGTSEKSADASKGEEPSEQRSEEQLHPSIELSAQVKLSEQIKALLEERLSYDAAKERAIDKLSEELRLNWGYYKDNFFFQLQKPIFIELIMLYDSLERTMNSMGTPEVLSKEQITERLQALKDELLEILYRRDIAPFDEHPEALDYKLHKTVKTVPTPEESENNKVDKIVKVGFRWNDKILRPEEVIIKKHIKSAV